MRFLQLMMSASVVSLLAACTTPEPVAVRVDPAATSSEPVQQSNAPAAAEPVEPVQQPDPQPVEKTVPVEPQENTPPALTEPQEPTEEAPKAPEPPAEETPEPSENPVPQTPEPEEVTTPPSLPVEPEVEDSDEKGDIMRLPTDLDQPKSVPSEEAARLGGGVASELDAAGAAAMERNVANALEVLSSGQSSDWSESWLGISGRILPGPSFEDDNGRECRSYRHIVTINGERREYRGFACRVGDGIWAEAEPPREASVESDQ